MKDGSVKKSRSRSRSRSKTLIPFQTQTKAHSPTASQTVVTFPTVVSKARSPTRVQTRSQTRALSLLEQPIASQTRSKTKYKQEDDSLFFGITSRTQPKTKSLAVKHTNTTKTTMITVTEVPDSERCISNNLDGTRCKRRAQDSGLCHEHLKMVNDLTHNYHKVCDTLENRYNINFKEFVIKRDYKSCPKQSDVDINIIRSVFDKCIAGREKALRYFVHGDTTSRRNHQHVITGLKVLKDRCY